MSNRTLWIVVAIGLVGVAGAALSYERWAGGTPVDALAVRSGPIREFVDEQGKTRLPRTYQMTMPYEGRILPIDLEEGSPVEVGQVVARMDPEDLDNRLAEARAAVDRLEAAIREERDVTVEESIIEQVVTYLESVARTVEAAEAQVDAGKAKRDFAEENLGRIQLLLRRNAASEEDLSRVRKERVEADVQYQQDILISSAIRSLQAAVTLTPSIIRQYIGRKELHADVLAEEQAQARARLEQVLLDQRRSTMTSPVDGVVLAREVTNERLLSAGAVLLEIGDLNQMEVEADILSQDAVRITRGQPVEIYGPAVGRDAVRGTVRRIDPAAFTMVSSLGVEQQRVRVVIAFEPETLAQLLERQRLGVGYRVRVRILTEEKSNALLVPRSALFRGADGRWQVFAVQDGRVLRKSVGVGLMNDELVEITQGLDEGELVIPAPEADLTDGARVRPIPLPEPDRADG